MTRDEKPFDRRLTEWLRDEAPEQAPDAILDAVAARIDELGQHDRAHRWRVALRLVASAAVVAALLIGAWTISRGTLQRGVTPAPTTAPRPADIPRDGTCNGEHECSGLLDPGQHATTLFTPSLTFSVPAGWENLEQSIGVMDLRPVDRPGDLVEFEALPAPRNADGTVAIGVGTSADALATWLARRPDLVTSGVQRANALGSSVPFVEFTVATDVDHEVTGCPASPCVAIASGLDPRERPTWGWDLRAWRGAAYRVYVVGDGDAQFLITVVAWSATDRAGIFGDAEAIIASLSPATP